MDAMEKWLQEHGIECKPYEARISPAACVTHQKRGDRYLCPCPAAVTGVEALPAKAPHKPPGLGFWLATGRKLVAPMAIGQSTERQPKRLRRVWPAKPPQATPEAPAIKAGPMPPAQRVQRGPRPHVCPPAEPYAPLEAELRRLAGLGSPPAKQLLTLLGGDHVSQSA